MLIQNVKGGYDFLPKEQLIRNYINDILRETFEEYGYNPVETPILCYYDILSDKYDENDDILKEIYRLSDQGKRDLGLRYDLTIPFSKLIALNRNKITLPFKRYEISKVFRDGPVKIGRDREFTQCDVDVVGIEGQYIEAELLSLFVSAFKKLNIDIVIKYNSRNLMTGLILETGISEDLVSNVTTVIDKKDKITKKEFCEYLKGLGLKKQQIVDLNKYFSLDLTQLERYFSDTGNLKLKIGLEEINNLNCYLVGLGIDNVCEFSSTLARGQNYYTGNVFEVYEKNGRIKGSIGAGGRYDKIISNFINDGNSYPTVGISFGLSSIYELLKGIDLFTKRSQIDFYIIPIGTDIESLVLANKLREYGYRVELEMLRRKLRKSMEYADKEKIPYVIVLGNDEVERGIFSVKKLETGETYEVSMSDLERIKNIL